MTERKYSVAELDALRRVMENKYLFGSYNPMQQNGMMSRAYMEQDKIRAVEEMVRTAMLAGYTASDYSPNG